MKKILFSLLTITSLNANSQLLAGMGAGYSDKSIYGEIILGAKVNKTALYYNQIALLSADKPAYFGLASSYDVFDNDSYKITLSGGYYFRKQSQDVDGKAGGNYFTTGIGISYNKEWFSVNAKYIDKRLQFGLVLSGLIGWPGL